MAFDSVTNRSNNENCKEHRWPRGPVASSSRSIGIVTHEQCNNCLAIRVTWSSDVLKNGEWITVTDERIIEPKFNL